MGDTTPSATLAAPEPHISVVVPVYRGEECLEELVRRLVSALMPLTASFEILLVEDCGPDKSWDLIQRLADQDPRVRGFQFTRNYGQHVGITAGIDEARGDWVVVMDCDLQDRPEDIPLLYHRALEGFDVVLARRMQRPQPAWKRATAAAFYWLFRVLTDLPYDGAIGNFRIFSRQVSSSFRQFREQLRFLGGIVTLMGYRVSTVAVAHDPRFAGESTYTVAKLATLAVRIILAYSDKPLRLAIRLGFGTALLAFAGALFFLGRALLYGVAVSGWASLIVSLYFLFGMMLGFMGIVGLYLGQVFEEVKRRPLYLIRARTDVGSSSGPVDVTRAAALRTPAHP